MAQEAAPNMLIAKRPKDMTPEEKKAYKKAYQKNWRSRNTVKARMEMAAERVAAKEAAKVAPSRPPGYFRAMAAKTYAKQKDDLKHCPICDCYIVSIRFAKHEITKKHEKAADEIRRDNLRLDRMFAELARQSREQNGRA